MMNPSYIGGTHATGGYLGDMGASPWCWTCTGQGDPWNKCAGSAYTYPYDDHAMGGTANTIECCVGTAADNCKDTGRQGTFVADGGFPQPTRNTGPPDNSPMPCTPCAGAAAKRDMQAAMGGEGEGTEVEGKEYEGVGGRNLTAYEEELRRRHFSGHGRRHHRPGGNNPWSPVHSGEFGS